MKKIFFMFVGIIIFMCSSYVFAANNYLNAVILEGTDNGYNIILRTDAIASVKRTVEGDDKVTLNIKGLVASDDISTMYRNTSSANGIVVENIANNEVKIEIQSNGVAKADIIFDSPASAPIVVTDKVSHRTTGWTVVSLILLCLLFGKARNIKVDSKEKIKAAVQKNMRDREIAMYKNYRREFLIKPSIDYKITSPKMKEAIRKADTIRHLQRVSRV